MVNLSAKNLGTTVATFCFCIQCTHLFLTVNLKFSFIYSSEKTDKTSPLRSPFSSFHSSKTHLEMASASRIPYQRLKHEDLFGDHEERERLIGRPSSRSWQRLKRMNQRKRFRLKIPSLRRFLRRKVKLVHAAYAKMLKRFKEGQAHFGDLFAGNYLFLQVNPNSLKRFEKAYHRDSNGLPPTLPLPSIA